MKLRTIARLMLAFVSLVFLVPLNSLPASADTLPVALVTRVSPRR